MKAAHIVVLSLASRHINEFIAEDAIGNDGYLLDAGLVPLADAKRAKLQKDAGALMVMSK